MPRSAAQLKKSWNTRYRGITKKADKMRDIFYARVAVFVEMNGVLYAYQSHDDFPNTLPGRLQECNKVTPEDFISLRQH